MMDSTQQREPMPGHATQWTSSYIKQEYGSWKYAEWILFHIPDSEGTSDRDTMKRMQDFPPLTMIISRELSAWPIYHFSLIISGYNYYAVF